MPEDAGGGAKVISRGMRKRHRKRSRYKRTYRVLFFLLVTSPVWLLAIWALLWFCGYVTLNHFDGNADG
jgi:hypothetical protein